MGFCEYSCLVQATDLHEILPFLLRLLFQTLLRHIFIGKLAYSWRDATPCPCLCRRCVPCHHRSEKILSECGWRYLAVICRFITRFQWVYTFCRNLIAIIDVKLLGASHLIKEAADGGSFAFEPEGLLSTIPCWAHVLLGAYVGSLITNAGENRERVRKIALFGTVLLFVGFLLQYLDPINKKLWTSSYTLVTCGAASLLLALLIDIIDVRQRKGWSRFFEAFGVNPLFMYCVGWIASVLFSLSFIPWNDRLISIRGLLYNQTLQPLLGDYLGSFIYALIFIIIIWGCGYILYRKRIYIKL